MTDDNAPVPAAGEDRQRLWDRFVENVVRRVVPEHYDLAQGLEKVELELMEREQALPLFPRASEAREFAREQQVLCPYAALRTFGAYELVRVIDSRLNPHGKPPLCAAAKELKRSFERVRVPLAKLAKARHAAAENPFHLADSQRRPSGDGGWLPGSDSISRRQLADELLEFAPDLSRPA